MPQRRCICCSGRKSTNWGWNPCEIFNSKNLVGTHAVNVYSSVGVMRGTAANSACAISRTVTKYKNGATSLLMAPRQALLPEESSDHH
ncbi:hypothetical protein LAZ67_16002201 [Cordylochernes scorpioides]|uniref:Uncharacterized protein n=1 Tax=Cordylochernes scorpioides TaxID=51811 RepID=A0ABY6LDW9_9ARAC|nr:hypothetical protein LAZ67_16002201 [Cordylochernes scorpioides]